MSKQNKPVEVATETKTETTPAKQEQKSNVVYLGPTIPGVVKNNDVYEDGILPEAVNAKIVEIPLLARLFVPLESFTEAVKDLRNETSVLGTIYAKVAQKI